MKIKREWRIGKSRFYITTDDDGDYFNAEIAIDPLRFLYVCVALAVIASLLMGLSK